MNLDDRVKTHQNDHVKNNVAFLVLLLSFCGPVMAQQGGFVPSVERGKTLYDNNCTVCHGIRGDGQTAAASALPVQPRAFSDPKLQEHLTPSAAFNTISRGKPSTGMPAFDTLSPQQRWDIAAYIFTLRIDFKDARIPRPELSWGQSKGKSDFQIAEIFRRRGVPEDYILGHVYKVRKFPE